MTIVVDKEQMKESRASKFLLTLIGSVFLLSGSCLLSAQAQTPSSDQLDMFRNLSPDQQRTVLDALGRGGSSGRSFSTPRVDRQLEFPELLRQRKTSDDEEEGTFDASGNRIQRVPKLKGDDTILLQLDIRD